MKKQYTKIATAHGYELYTVKKMSRGAAGKSKYQYHLYMYTLINTLDSAKFDQVKDTFGISAKDERGYVKRGYVKHTCKNKDDAMQKLVVLRLMGLYE